MDLKVKLREDVTNFKVQPVLSDSGYLLSGWAEEVFNQLLVQADSRIRTASVEDVKLVFAVFDTLNSLGEDELSGYWPSKFLDKGVPQMLASFSRPLWVRFDNNRLKGYDYQVSYDLEGRLDFNGATFQRYEDALSNIAMLRRGGDTLILSKLERKGETFSESLRKRTCVDGNIHWDPDESLFLPVHLWIPVRESVFYNCSLEDVSWRSAMLRHLVNGFKQVKKGEA